MRTLFVALMLSSGCLARAADWLPVSKATDGTTFYVDSASLHQVAAERVSFWSKVDYAATTPRNQAAAYDIDQMEIDCAERTYRTLSVLNYSSRGDVLGSTSGMPPPAKPIPPQSSAEQLLDVVCDSKVKTTWQQ